MRGDFPVLRHVLNLGNPKFQKVYLDFSHSVTSRPPIAVAKFLIDSYSNDPNLDIVLVAAGPLTNVARALATAPQLADRIPQFVIIAAPSGRAT